MTLTTLPQFLIAAALLLQLLLILFVPKTPFAWHRALGCLALAVGAAAGGWLLFGAGELLWRADWRAAAQQVLLLYVLGTASWLAWKASKPY